MQYTVTQRYKVDVRGLYSEEDRLIPAYPFDGSMSTGEMRRAVRDNSGHPALAEQMIAGGRFEGLMESLCQAATYYAGAGHRELMMYLVTLDGTGSDAVWLRSHDVVTEERVIIGPILVVIDEVGAPVVTQG